MLAWMFSRQYSGRVEQHLAPLTLSHNEPKWNQRALTPELFAKHFSWSPDKMHIGYYLFVRARQPLESCLSQYVASGLFVDAESLSS